MRINEVLNSIPNEKAKWGGVFPDDGMDQFDFKTNNGIGYELHLSLIHISEPTRPY